MATTASPILGELSHAASSPLNSAAGLLLLAGSPLKPVYANQEAIRILAYPDHPQNIAGLDRFLARRIAAILFEYGYEGLVANEFTSGRRHYLCRAFSLAFDAGNPVGRPEVAVLLERSGTLFNSSRLAQQYHLTAREQETLRFLTMGLTNKDIALRMHVSPHTVKAFLRTIMIKMGASTRSGIVAKCTQRNLSAGGF